MRRLWRNAGIALASAAVTVIVFELAREKDSLAFRWSMATGYTSVGLIGLALLLGPLWVMQGRRVPTSADVRRDVGLWGAAYALLHVVTGLQVHMRGDMLNYFLYRPRDGVHLLPLRLDPFGLANWTGLAATVLLVILMAISNDRSLRALGPKRWKTLQQSTYVAAVLIALHGIAFQLMDRRRVRFILLFGVILVTVTAMQLYGSRRVGAARDKPAV